MMGDRLRVALYSPGMVGLGHFRRNLLLVRRLAAAWPQGAFLMLTEARESAGFDMPDNVDCISLPSLRKDEHGCRPRRLRLDLADVVRLRASVLATALTHFSPDLLIVDHLPCGAVGELAATLEHVRSRGGRLVLGLRDILEEPTVVQAEWARAGHAEVIRDHYDAVWVYGERHIFDPITEYGWPGCVADKVVFTGYLDPLGARPATEPKRVDCPSTRIVRDERVIVCQLGGGHDGIRLAEAFIEADLPDDAVGVLLTGPFMARADRERLESRALRRPGQRHVLSLIGEPMRLLARADRVITMGGYNSMCEVVSLGKHALVVPRTHPRREQLIRARRFAELGLVDVLEPKALSRRAVSDWISRPIPPGRPRGLDMHGLDRVVGYAEDVLEGRNAAFYDERATLPARAANA